MFHSELEIRVRHEELRRAADRQRLVREATAGRRAAARSGDDEPEGRVRAWGRWARVRRAAA
ncbi:hypothetical protein HXP44_15015 [Streptomyces sioyaensis]|uniref:Uncharacterized protein n=1 Tax=Streptomyces sioyaensis TaxID=67364 RepID=A0A4Q1QUI8_9ACTN|nr:hypothetical protein [Streptomyces sioyaensis]MBM4793328.1 hypothetical protein [Streptomyces sioyaensis]RXS65895.1 hypothetical protein EST54_17220 [Streptomyces sioyaensis]